MKVVNVKTKILLRIDVSARQALAAFSYAGSTFLGW
jgi:hypothetical protein